MVNPAIFFDPDLNKPVMQDILPPRAKSIVVPPQIPDEYVGSVSTAADATQAMSSSSGLILILNLFAGVGLKQIWKAVNILQFICYCNDWKLAPPGNLKIFFV